MGLTSYRKKRRFEKSPEPPGQLKVAPLKQPYPLFVIQKHWASHLHYDFRLEQEGVLKSWAIPKGPSLNPADKRLAVKVEDHPLDYGEFEGVIPEGNYGAGTVNIWDRGFYFIDEEKMAKENEALLKEGIKKGSIKFFLVGENLKGAFKLVQIKSSKNWLLIKADDEFTNPSLKTADDILIQGIRGVKKSPYLKHPQPMLAHLSSKSFDNPDWLFEIKWDGYRAIAEIKNGKAKLYSRRRQLMNRQYPEIVEELEKRFPDTDIILDGEVVALDQRGLANFQHLQTYPESNAFLVFYIFDVLFYGSYDLTSAALIDRKKWLKKILPSHEGMRYVDHVEDKGMLFFERAKSQGIEGIIAKEKHSHYLKGRRSKKWLKIKTYLRQEAVIGGYTEPRKTRRHLGALVLGVYEKGKLVYVGHTGAGQSAETLEEIYRLLHPLETDKCPFSVTPKTNEKAHWVQPKYVAEVRFSEWTKDQKMRQPILIALRDDKDPREIYREKIHEK